MDSSSESQEKCPLTGNALPEDALEVAVVFGVAIPSPTMKMCGHACTMGALMDVLQDQGAVKCPECEKSFVISVCDASAAETLCGSQDSSCELIAFRYGRQVYWLTVPGGSEITAQDRITQALGIEDVRMLHGGKKVFPDSAKTPDEISNDLIAICQEERGQKPSLTIMGRRTGHWGAQGGHIRR